MEWLNTVLTILASLSGGGIITYFVTLRYQRTKAKEEAHQEELESDKNLIDNVQGAADKQIENAQKLIDMYKSGMNDLSEMYRERESQYKEKIDQLEKKYSELKKFSDLQGKQLEQMQEVIDKMRLEVESLRKLSEHNCDFCEFKEGCKKYTALRKAVNKK